MLLVGGTAHEELSVTAPHRNGDHAGTDQLGDASPHVVLPGHCARCDSNSCVLRVRPRFGAGVVGVLQPAVGVGDLLAVEGLDEVEAFGLGVVRARRDAAELAGMAGNPMARSRARWLWAFAGPKA